MPDVSHDGKVLYSLYENGRYRISLIDSVRLLDETIVGYKPDYFTKFDGLQAPLSGQNSYESYDYEDVFSSTFIFPRLQIDYGMVKPGFYFLANEMTNRLSLFGGAAVNALSDLDLFLLFELKIMLRDF